MQLTSSLLAGKFSVSNCSRQFWLKCTYIDPTRDTSFQPYRTEGIFRKHNSKTFRGFSLGSAKQILFCGQGCVKDKGFLECADSLACDGKFKLVSFLVVICFSFGRRIQAILILNEDFLPTVFGFSNVSANPGLKFRNASTWEARHFSGQLCHLALSTVNLLCVVASLWLPTPCRALISSVCDCYINVLTFLMTSVTFSFLNCSFFFSTE